MVGPWLINDGRGHRIQYIPIFIEDYHHEWTGMGSCCTLVLCFFFLFPLPDFGEKQRWWRSMVLPDWVGIMTMMWIKVGVGGAQTQCCGWRCSKIWPKMMKHVPSFGLYCMNWNSVNIFVGILKPTLPVRTVEQSSLQGVRGHSSLRFWGLAGAVAGGEWCNYHGIPSWTVPGHVWAVHEVGTPGRMLIVVTQVLTSLWLSSFRSSDGGDLFWWDRWVGPALLRSSLSTPCCADMSIEGGPTNKFINSSSHLGIHTCKPIYSTYIYIIIYIIMYIMPMKSLLFYQ